MCLVATLAGAESWVDIAEFGKKKIALLRRFRAFEKGTPSHDQLGDLFAVLDAEQFQSCFISWVGSLTGFGPDIVASDADHAAAVRVGVLMGSIAYGLAGYLLLRWSLAETANEEEASETTTPAAHAAS